MPSIQPRRRRSRIGLMVMMIITFLLLGLGLFLTLWAIGVPLASWGETKTPYNPHLVRIPVNIRAVSAYQKVGRADLIDPSTGWVKYQQLPAQSAIGMSISGVGSSGKLEDGKVVSVRHAEGQLAFVLESGQEILHNQVDKLGGALMNVSSIVGRVVRKDKRPGLGFREENFFPPGTPEGIAGATPPGMRAIVLNASSLTGVHSIPAGARCDLIANIPIEDLSSFSRDHSSLPGASLLVSSSGDKNRNAGRTEPIMLAQEALLLRPVYQRVEATTSSSLTQGTSVRSVPVYEVAIAVQPEDVIPLQSAMNRKLEVVCVAHSMQPATESNTVAPLERDGLIAPVTSRTVLAYETLTYDYFKDAATRSIRREPVTDEEVSRLGVITSVAELVGAKVKHNIPKGSFITRSDLLSPVPNEESESEPLIEPDPNQAAQHRQVFHLTAHQPNPSTVRVPSSTGRGRPNIVGEARNISKFVPPGFKAVVVPWNRLYGAEHLVHNDTIDLIVSFPLRFSQETNEKEYRSDGTVIERLVKQRVSEPTERTYDETLGFRGEPWVAAMDARVIGPLGYPLPDGAVNFFRDSSIPAGNTDKASGPPIVFAVNELDYEAISAAMSTEDALFSIVIHPPSNASEVPQGWKRIVLAPNGMPAFERVTSADLEQSHTRRQLTRLVRADDEVFENALTEAELRPLLGRVLRAYKSRHTFFTEDDFFPADVKPGLSADIGNQSAVYVALDSDIEGLDNFRDNDHIAIVFRRVVKSPQGVISHGIDLERPVSSVVVKDARILRSSQNGRTVLEIANGELNQLQAAWSQAFAERDGASDSQDRSRRLHLVAVSRRVGASGANTETNSARDVAAQDIPAFDPLANTSVRVLEALVGGDKKIHVFGSSSNISSDSGE